MKKISTLLFALMFVVTISEAQIPNNGFETWDSVGTHINPSQWSTLNNTTALASTYTATKGTPGMPGNSYLKLTSLLVATSVVPGIAVSGMLDSLTLTPSGGFPCTLQPMNFTGKWQHMIYGSSQGSIAVTLSKWNGSSRDVIATANVTLTGMAMSWASFTIPFSYQSTVVPDTCLIVLKSSGSAPTASDYLWVDNLAFSGSVAGIENNNFLSNLNVYPNPANKNLNLDLNFKTSLNTTIELSDLTGKIIFSKDAGILSGESKQTLDISSFSKGAYFVKIITSQGTEVRNIVIE